MDEWKEHAEEKGEYTLKPITESKFAVAESGQTSQGAQQETLAFGGNLIIVTDKGQKKSEQQDCAAFQVVKDGDRLVVVRAVVADGMTHHDNGQGASRILVEQLLQSEPEDLSAAIHNAQAEMANQYPAEEEGKSPGAVYGYVNWNSIENKLVISRIGDLHVEYIDPISDVNNYIAQPHVYPGGQLAASVVSMQRQDHYEKVDVGDRDVTIDNPTPGSFVFLYSDGLADVLSPTYSEEEQKAAKHFNLSPIPEVEDGYPGEYKSDRKQWKNLYPLYYVRQRIMAGDTATEIADHLQSLIQKNYDQTGDNITYCLFQVPE